MKGLERDRSFEQDATREYALGHDVERLISHAERRADTRGDIVWIDPEQLIREVLEELADARNYLVWILLSIQRYDLDWDAVRYTRALAFVNAAYAVLTT